MLAGRGNNENLAAKGFFCDYVVMHSKVQHHSDAVNCNLCWSKSFQLFFSSVASLTIYMSVVS